MSPSDPQFLYLILVVPSIFGVTLLVDGIYKVLHDDGGGYAILIFGLMFLAVVGFSYFFFKIYLTG